MSQSNRPVPACAVVVVSDRRSRQQAEDTTGPVIAEWIATRGWTAVPTVSVPDDAGALSKELVRLTDEGVNLVLTTGGTGLGARDVTPEATLAVAHRVVPGIHEWIRASTGANLPAAFLSRGVAVLRDSTLIVNLPGSPRAVSEYLAHLGKILPHALAQVRSAPGSPDADRHPTE